MPRPKPDPHFQWNLEDIHAVTVERPKQRGQCMGRPGLCPYVGCRHHLLLDVKEDTGSIVSTRGRASDTDDEIVEQLLAMETTCSLDVADAHLEEGIFLEEIGQLINCTREWVRQIEVQAQSKLHKFQLSVLTETAIPLVLAERPHLFDVLPRPSPPPPQPEHSRTSLPDPEPAPPMPVVVEWAVDRVLPAKGPLKSVQSVLQGPAKVTVVPSDHFVKKQTEMAAIRTAQQRAPQVRYDWGVDERQSQQAREAWSISGSNPLTPSEEDMGQKKAQAKTLKPKRRMRPKRGDRFTAMVAGGSPTLHEQFKANLPDLGVDVVATLTVFGKTAPVPDHLDVVLMVKDQQISRQVRESFAYSCKQAGAFVLHVQPSHKAAMVDLRREGFELATDHEPFQPVPSGAEKGVILEELPEAVKAITAETTAEDIIEKYTPVLPELVMGPAQVLPIKKLHSYKDAGPFLASRRQVLNIERSEMARDLGCSTSFIMAVEKGKMAASDVWYAGFEHYYGLEPLTLPRGQTQRQKKKGPPMVRARGLMPTANQSQTTLTANPPAEPVPTMPSVQVLPETRTVTQAPGSTWDRKTFMLQLLEVQEGMRHLGVSKVELTPKSVHFTEE